MALRLLEVYHPPEEVEKLSEILSHLNVIEIKQIKLSRTQRLTKILLNASEAEGAINALERFFPKDKPLRIVILPVEASVPRPEPEEEEEGRKKPERMSIEELYQDVIDQSRPTPSYFLFVLLSAVVASVGILLNNPAIIIGSMVIAPLLMPNMALSLATTLADEELMKVSIITALSGYGLAFATGALFGLFFKVNLANPEILSRTELNLLFLLLALASGVAGALSFTKGVSQLLVGVMIAVALLPPLVASGLLFGSRFWFEGLRALLLFFANVVCINLAGVATFLALGVTPKKWWERRKAKKLVRRALLIWGSFLVLATALILIYQLLYR